MGGDISDSETHTNIVSRLRPDLLQATEKDDVNLLCKIITQARENGYFSDELLHLALMRSIKRGCVAALEYFLQIGADPNASSSSKGPLSLFSAIHRGNDRAVRLLLDYGASPNIFDQEGRTPLMTAAWKNEVTILSLLISRGANINATDERKRNVLHHLAADQEFRWGWEENVVLVLLQNHCKADEQDELGRTPLHWACERGHYCLVNLLLNGPGGPYVNIHATELRGKTALHLSAIRGQVDVLELLLKNGASVVAVSDGNWTPLHNACYHGSVAIVRSLLHCGAPINSQLLNGVTPLHLAAQAGHLEVVRCLLERPDLKYYAYDNFGGTPFMRAAQSKHNDILHLLAPSNNFKKLSDDQQAACMEFDATIMDYGVEGTIRFRKSSIFSLLYREDPDDSSGQAMRVTPSSESISFRWIHLPANNMAWVETLFTKVFIERDTYNFQEFGSLMKSLNFERHHHSQIMLPLSQISHGVAKDSETSTNSHIGFFLPYLHFDTAERVQKMQMAIKHAKSSKSRLPDLKKTRTHDELLMEAHISTPATPLHPRQTLDQYFYPHTNTERRDQDQVVYRYQTRSPGRKVLRDVEPKLIMVDRMWMWILGEDLLITCFPKRWDQPKHDPSNLQETIIEGLFSASSWPVESVYDLAAHVTDKCLGLFDSENLSHAEYQFFDMFESSINLVNDREVVFFSDFYQSSKEASNWLKNQRRPSPLSRIQSLSQSDPLEDNSNIDGNNDPMLSRSSPHFVDRMLDIGEETDMLAEVKDIRDELNIIRHLLEHQTQILSRFQQKIKSVNRTSSSQTVFNDCLENRQLRIELRLQYVNRMDQQAERVYLSMVHLLDLKQKQANAFEARFARDQAEGTARQGKILMVFTMVTIVFLPLSFLTSFFAINMREFSDLSIGFVSKWTFGIGFAISIPLILIAISVDNIGFFFGEMRHLWGSSHRERPTSCELLVGESEMGDPETRMDSGKFFPSPKASGRSSLLPLYRGSIRPKPQSDGN